MNTPGHVVLNLAIFARKGKPKLNLRVTVGALIPDMPIFFLYAVERFVLGNPDRLIWSERYFLPVWQNFIDLFNSLPLMAVGWFVARRLNRPLVALCFLSMGVHALLDLPVHAEDAHRHFYPFLQFRFESPVSYWDPAKFGGIVALFETAFVLGGCVYVYRMMGTRVGKVGLALVGALYATLYTVFYVMRVFDFGG